MTTSDAPPPPDRGYLRRLLAFLSVATFFEGFDYIALTQILPSLRDDLGLDRAEGGVLLGAINVGGILAYALIRQADRFGRKTMLNVTIAGYTLATLATAASQNAWQFGLCQLVARAFLLAEFAVSMVYASEEFPAEERALTAGLIQGFNSLGAIVCAGVVPMLLSSSFGWRAVYLVGAVPLVLLAFARRGIRETARFESARASGETLQTDLWSVLRPPYRGRVLLLALIWSLTYMCTNVTVTFWKEFAVAERGFDDAAVSRAVVIAALGALPCVFAAGKLLETLGRHRGAGVIFVVASVSTVTAYTLHGFWPLTLALMAGIFSASAVLPVLTVYTLELFPTSLRAGAFAWANNLLGRIGYVISPPLVGAAAERVGYGPALAATAVFPLLALALILTRLPETRGLSLEQTSAA